MAEALAYKAGDVRKLDSSATKEVLCKSAGSQAALRLVASSGSGSHTVNGKLVSFHEDHMVVEFGSVGEAAELSKCESFLHGTLDGGRLLYFFKTEVVKSGRPGKKPRVAIKCPEWVQSFERRRSPRKSLQEATPISFRSETDESLCFHGALLNVSADGMASLVQDQQAREGLLEPRLRVVFSLGEEDPFDLLGRVANVTRGSKKGTSILGIEFVFLTELDEERTRLAQALASASE